MSCVGPTPQQLFLLGPWVCSRSKFANYHEAQLQDTYASLLCEEEFLPLDYWPEYVWCNKQASYRK